MYKGPNARACLARVLVYGEATRNEVDEQWEKEKNDKQWSIHVGFLHSILDMTKSHRRVKSKGVI